MVHSPLYILSIIFMSIIKPTIKSKIESILAFRNMNETGEAETETGEAGTPEEGPEAIYTNTPPGGGSFEDRFSFRRESLLPPPVPSKATLERGTRTGTIPKIQKVPLSPLTPRTHSSPKTSARGYDFDSSFESGIESISKEESKIRLDDGKPEELHLDVHHLGVHDVQDVRDKRDRSPVHLGQSQTSHLGQSPSSHLDQYPGDKDQLLGMNKQPLPQDKDLPLPLGQHLDSHYKIDISVSKTNDTMTTEEEDLDFWMD